MTAYTNLLDPAIQKLRRLFYRRIDAKTVATARGLVLDVGNNGNTYYRNILGDSCRYVALDYPETVGEFPGGSSGVDVLGDGQVLPIQTDSIDTIICSFVLEHIPEPQLVLNEAFRVLKPGGQAIFHVPQNTLIHGRPHHYFNITQFGMRYLARNAGFRIVELETIGGFWNHIAVRMFHFPFLYCNDPYFVVPKKRSVLQRAGKVLLSPLLLLAVPLFFASAMFFSLVSDIEEDADYLCVILEK